MSMFGARKGTWWLKSKADPRWDVYGREDCMFISAGMCQNAFDELERMKKELGEPPDDLEYGCMKD